MDVNIRTRDSRNRGSSLFPRVSDRIFVLQADNATTGTELQVYEREVIAEGKPRKLDKVILKRRFDGNLAMCNSRRGEPFMVQ
ncbi:MAG: hypothetical protein EBV06_02475 [Planctomycetia bacterium]|nr:hypothetical protein [Planctomycetia bacterium]